MLRLSSSADARLVANALRDVVERHEPLRTVFSEAADGSILQIVRRTPAGTARLRLIETPDADALEARIRRDVRRPFDLTRSPFRAKLYRQADTGARYLCVVVHHIAFDGWSIDLLLGDLLALYRRREARAEGLKLPPAPPALPMTYSGHAHRERAQLTGERLDGHLEFWRRYLDGHEALRLPIDRRRPEVPDYRGANLRFELEASVSRDLRGLARKLRVSLFSVLVSAYFLALRCYCYQDDIVIGAPFSNRRHMAIDRLIGVFINTMPLRARIDARTLLSDFIGSVAQDIQTALQHQEAPFEALVDAIGIPPDRIRHPIYQALFDVQSFGRDFRDPDAPVSLASKSWEHITAAKYDLSVFVDNSAERLDVFVNYATSLFDEDTIASFSETYAEMLRQFAVLNRDVTAQWRVSLRDLRLLRVDAHRRIIEESGVRQSGPRPAVTICERFEAQAQARGNAAAVCFEDGRLSYRSLNRRANRVARHLRAAHGVLVGATVALCLDRSEDLIVAVLAVLKSGGAYVPIEPSYPDNRIRFIVKDCGASVVLTQQRWAGRIGALVGPAHPDSAGERAPHAPAVLALDATILRRRLEQESPENLGRAARPETPAYVIYTSGSSGEPKGVVQTHRNVLGLFEATRTMCDIASGDVWPLCHSYAFDFSVWEIWGALLHGGRLVVTSDEDVRDPERLHSLCRRVGATILNQTPAAFSAFMRVALERDQRDLAALRYVLIGGERWNVDMLLAWFRRFGDRRPTILHVYGPTETTVFATMQRIALTRRGVDPSLGPALANMSAYVVDQEFRLAPSGAIGELCLGGVGLASGYLNREELTAEKFLANPFQTEADRLRTDEGPLGRNAQIYRTGDLVRRSPDGRLTFVDRNDLQVKLRGYRIEVGEIEAAIAAFPGISQGVAVVRSDVAGGEQGEHLAAYYVSRGHVDESALLDHLAQRLPSFMLPTTLTAIERMPLGPTGKIDRRALPMPQPIRDVVVVGPRHERERGVRRLYAEILGLDEDSVSVDANFFALGPRGQ